MDKILVTIYLMGIGAFVNLPPNNNVTKQVVFPNASASDVKYDGVTLMPHHVFLYVRGLENAEDCEYLENSTPLGDVCKAELSGARVWINPVEPLTEDGYFRKIPSFLKSNKAARDLPDWYMADPGAEPNPDWKSLVPVPTPVVAARFDIKGGTLSGCNRNFEAFVAKIDATSSDGVLYVQQNQRTARLPLVSGAVIAIENRPDHHMPGEWKNHYGWYYVMNGRVPGQPITDKEPQPVKGVPLCPPIPGADSSGPEGIASADCAVTTWP